jgi:magnesium transporter
MNQTPPPANFTVDDLRALAGAGGRLPQHLRGADLAALFGELLPEERYACFMAVVEMDREIAADLLSYLEGGPEKDVLEALPPEVLASLIREFSDDDAASIFSSLSSEKAQDLFLCLSREQAERIGRILRYPPESAGRRMIGRYIALPPAMTAGQAIARIQALRDEMEDIEMVYYLYVVDDSKKLLGVLSMRRLLLARPQARLDEIMSSQVVKAGASEDQEAAAKRMSQYGLMAIPVTDEKGRLEGIFTADDAMDVIREEATEDIQKLGGSEALGEPYLTAKIGRMIWKRAGWLTVLFLGEMLTATAMAHFEEQIARAVVLALFVPLIISSGGNSGSQASTLVIRAMALGELHLRDWWRVVSREVLTGLGLGAILAVIGFLRIFVSQSLFGLYGEHFMRVGLTVAMSLLGVVMMGTLAGAGLPFLLRRLGLDPASASAPFVATFVDVSGLVLYFSVAIALLGGTVI